jgi:hypothetical protein
MPMSREESQLEGCSGIKRRSTKRVTVIVKRAWDEEATMLLLVLASDEAPCYRESILDATEGS